MKITVLDAGTLGEDLSLEPLENLGECNIYKSTESENVAERIGDSEVLILNKVKINATNLASATNLKLICVTATGYDNIDIDYCRRKNIAVCNVVGYSSNSVAQLTMAIVLSLSVHLDEYTLFVKNGGYSESNTANRLIPVYNEIAGKIWGIVGYGNIGKMVGNVANALGCKVIVNKKTPIKGVDCVDIDTLCEKADIITIHTPLNSETKNLISAERIAKMKKNVILVNVARGAVVDEEAIAEAIKNGQISGFGTDVYTTEPFRENHPFYELRSMPNVCMTPHCAWGALEARERCIEEIVKNINAFYNGETRNRVDLV